MNPTRAQELAASIDPDAHRRLANQLHELLNSKGEIEGRELLGVVRSMFRELETVQRKLNLLPESASLGQWFWRPMRQRAAMSTAQPKAYVFCLADTHAHVRDGQSLITLARHLSFLDAPAVQVEPIPVRAERQQLPKVLHGITPTVAMLVGRPVLFGSLMRQYFQTQSAPQRFTFTQEDPDAPDQGLRDEHFGDVFAQRRFKDEGEWVTEDYGLVRRFTFDEGPASRTFYVVAGLSSLGTYAATLCSLFLLEQLQRDLSSPPEERSQFDVLLSAAATHGEAFWNLDASNVRVVRAYLDDLVFQAEAGTGWQGVPPRRIELVLRGPAKTGALNIDHIVLDRLQREVIPGSQQQARIIGCLVHRSVGRKADGTSGTDLADQKWIWHDRGRDKDKKVSPSEAVSKMLNVARRHLGGALISRDNRYFVEVTGDIKIRQA